MFVYFQIENKVPSEHPLRFVKALADLLLARLSPQFDKLFPRVAVLRFRQNAC